MRTERLLEFRGVYFEESYANPRAIANDCEGVAITDARYRPLERLGMSRDCKKDQ